MSPAWNKAVDWIESNGGYVHPSLRYDDAERQVFVGSTSSGLPPIEEKGTILMTIPDVCLVSLHSVERDDSSPFGMSLFRAVHSLECAETMSQQPGESAPIKSSGDPSGIGKTLYNNSQDVILALYLSHLKEISGGDSGSEGCFFGPYLATLPADSKKLLPRQWTAEALSRRLSGTSLYSRAMEEREGIRREYELVKKTWLDGNMGSEGDFPGFELYDSMMAMVTSRAFASLGYDGVDAMIPLLDLLNHARGNRGENMLRYERYDKNGSEASSEPMVKRQKIPGGGVHVRTSKPVSEGSALNMTYGAKGNVTLLGRYGFCIDDNIEPDGTLPCCLSFL